MSERARGWCYLIGFLLIEAALWRFFGWAAPALLLGVLLMGIAAAHAPNPDGDQK